MGLFDNLRCHYPLPVVGANARYYQTKDTPCQRMNEYEITEEGLLRHREWDADTGPGDKWIWHPDFVGEVRFDDKEDGGGRIKFSAHFVNGALKELRLLGDTTKAAAAGKTTSLTHDPEVEATQTTRELDVLAARAAGFTVVGTTHPPDGVNVLAHGAPFVWRPRVDDGDAFRLANDLRMNVFHAAGAAYALPADGDGGGEQQVYHRDAPDPHAAMRLAIVRVAAAVEAAKARLA